MLEAFPNEVETQRIWREAAVREALGGIAVIPEATKAEPELTVWEKAAIEERMSGRDRIANRNHRLSWDEINAKMPDYIGSWEDGPENKGVSADGIISIARRIDATS